MPYVGAIYRPPSEARSFILQVTVGCSHNRCTFCSVYKDKRFQIKSLEEIAEDLKEVREYAPHIKRVFLADGDALIIPQKKLVKIMEMVNETFPDLERVGIYGNAKSILRKSVEELKALRDLKLEIVYIGLESGNDEILKKVKKGDTTANMIEAASRIHAAGITLSVTVILGLGGKEMSRIHAIDTGKVLSQMDPEFAAALSLMLVPPAPLCKEYEEGRFHLPGPFEMLEELALIIAHMDVTHCFFSSNHASNYLPVQVWLPEGKEEILALIREVIEKHDRNILRPEAYRGL
ncbi:MAG: radical SAM protein [Deltaproteobacteria bacterium]|nr:MAG: radical SAM protein [Deltaproteobacteria bacterium]